jgi:uncharacterized protein (DUF305 family)
MRQKLLVYTIAGLIASAAVTGTAIANKSQITSQPANESPCPDCPLLGQRQAGMEQVDQHFIEMMIPHHEDAVEMAKMALTRAKQPQLKKLAIAIQKDQTREIEQMRSWYKQWYGVEIPATPTGGMMGNHGGMHAGMGNMMEMDLDTLKTAPDFDREFIRQMIPHHRMAVRMATMLQRRTARPEMRKLAGDIIRSQTAEINQMQQWYQTWYRR